MSASIPQKKFLAKFLDLEQVPEVATVKHTSALSNSSYSSLDFFPP